jgi:hypothetical protein
VVVAPLKVGVVVEPDELPRGPQYETGFSEKIAHSDGDIVADFDCFGLFGGVDVLRGRHVGLQRAIDGAAIQVILRHFDLTKKMSKK